MSPGIVAVRRKSENIQISFEAISLSNDQNFPRKFQYLLSPGEIEITEDLHAIFSFYVKTKNN